MMSLSVTYGGAYLGNDLVTDLGQAMYALCVRGGLGYCHGYCRGYCRLLPLGADDTLTVQARVATSNCFVHDAPPMIPGNLLLESERLLARHYWFPWVKRLTPVPHRAEFAVLARCASTPAPRSTKN
jgi:hypothetical protein